MLSFFIFFAKESKCSDIAAKSPLKSPFLRAAHAAYSLQITPLLQKQPL